MQPEAYIFINQDSGSIPSIVIWIDFPGMGRGQEKGHRMGLRVRKERVAEEGPEEHRGGDANRKEAGVGLHCSTVGSLNS